MAYGDFKDLPRRTASDKVLCDKAFNIGKKSLIVYKFFDKETSGSNTSGGTVKVKLCKVKN